MSLGDAHRGTAKALAHYEREPLWAIGLSALLVATGLARRPAGPHSGRADHTELEAGRGRFAEGPSEIPARGWKDILLRVYDGISEDRILANAAGVTYYALLALFPGIAALVSIYGLFADPATIVSHLDAIAGFAPGGAVDVIRDQLTRLAAQGSTTLGISFAVGLVISLWSANAGIKALFDALNAVYQEKEKRSFIRLNALTLSFTIATIAFLLIALAAVVALPIILNYLPLPGVIGLLLEIARWPILLVLVAFGLTLIYRYGPSRTEPRWQWITWGQRVCGDQLACRFGAILVVCGKFWHLQQNLWLARRHYRIYDLDVAVDHRHSGRRQAQCGNRASDGARKHHRPA
jgi:membrane protein